MQTVRNVSLYPGEKDLTTNSFYVVILCSCEMLGYLYIERNGGCP